MLSSEQSESKYEVNKILQRGPTELSSSYT